MAARPVSTSLGALSSHVLSRSLPRASRRVPAVALSRHQPCAQPQTRAFTYSACSRNSDPPKSTDEDSKTPESSAETAAADSNGEPQEQPWYLQVEPPSHPPVHEPAPLPAMPAGSPEILEPVVKYVYEEMGLDDINLLDLRDFDPPPALGQNLIMLFGTARSERHLHVASGRLVRWLRYNYKLEADADGLIGPGELKTKLRRLRRKAKLLGSNASSVRGADDGLSTGWICVNLGSVGSESAETARFDSSGQLSGFGNAVPATGSTVVIQVMTESRRAELNLETLWSDSLKRNQRQRENFSSAPPRGPRMRHTSRPGAAPSSSFRPLGGHIQKRSYASTHVEPYVDTDAIAHEFLSPLRLVRQRMLELRSPADLSEEFDSLVSRVFSSKVPEAYAHEQINLVEELLRMRWRHDSQLITQGMLITLICAIAQAKSKSPLLERAQTNLETLMAIKQYPCPEEAELIRLLGAYSVQRNWDRFWETWRLPPRFGLARSEDLYANMFEFVASTRDATACMKAVRSCLPEMQFEDPVVLPTDRIYNGAIECLSIADPDAIPMADDVESGEATFKYTGMKTGSDLEKEMFWARKLFERQREREFVQIVHDLRFVRRQMDAMSKEQDDSEAVSKEQDDSEAVSKEQDGSEAPSMEQDDSKAPSV